MLSIRFQRTGRRGQAKFRVVVQDSRRSPTSGRVVANLGHYNPHSKEHGVDFDRLVVYLKNGAQPSSRVIHLLTTNKIDLPAWVRAPAPRQRPVRQPQKLRRNRPAEAADDSDSQTAPTDEPAPDTDQAQEADDQSAANDVSEETKTDAGQDDSGQEPAGDEAADKSKPKSSQKADDQPSADGEGKDEAADSSDGDSK